MSREISSRSVTITVYEVRQKLIEFFSESVFNTRLIFHVSVQVEEGGACPTYRAGDRGVASGRVGQRSAESSLAVA